MIAVTFHFEEWLNKAGNLEPSTSMRRWVGDSKILGADTLILIDKTTFKVLQYYTHNDPDITYLSYDDFTEVEEAFPEASIVYLEDKYFLDENNIEGTNLLDFKHPSGDVIYVVGPNYGSLEVLEARKDKIWVYIPTNPRYALFADITMFIVLYDRLSKAVE